MSGADIQQLTEGAFKYGPFFFSILFVIFLWRWSYKKYDAAVTHIPALAASDQNINRAMFSITFLFGFVLVVVSIIWWWWFKPNVYFFKGEIHNLQPQDEIAADVYYLRKEVRDSLSSDGGDGVWRNEHFLIFQASPFKKGQQFQLDFSKNHQRRTILWITYDPDEEEPSYEIDYDESSQKSILKRSSPTTHAGILDRLLSTFEPTVSAAQAAPPEATKKTPLAQIPNSERRSIQILQDPYSDVATKLNVIDDFNRKDLDIAKAFLTYPGAEPFALTVFDLTQHSDPELASKAALLAKRLDIDSFLISELQSSDFEIRTIAERVLLRISRSHAQRLLQQIDITRHEDLKKTAADVASGANTKILKATSSAKGDRYYVKATWEANNSTTVNCLTQLFNQELESTRTVNEEKALMKGRSQRYVYDYTKGWAIQVSGQIKDCGGTAEFVRPY